MFEADAAGPGVPSAADGTAFGLQITQIDGTTLEMAADPALAAAFGVPSAGTRPLLRLTGLLDAGTAGGKPPRSAATSTARTPWPTS